MRLPRCLRLLDQLASDRPRSTATSASFSKTERRISRLEHERTGACEHELTSRKEIAMSTRSSLKPAHLRAAPLAVVAVATFASFLGLAQATSPDGALRAKVVAYSGADLQNSDGISKLYARINRAASLVCEPLARRDNVDRTRWNLCVEQAIDTAVADINSARLTELHFLRSHSLALTAANRAIPGR
jgi:UrcA family protein